MKILEYKEKKPHGSRDFPVEVYNLDEQHPQYVMPCHWHDECELIYVREGTFAYLIEGESGTAGPGDILFVNSGAMHEGIPEGSIYHCLVFDINLLMKSGNACRHLLSPFAEGDSRVRLRLPCDRALQTMIEALFDSMNRCPPGYMLVTQGLLYQLYGYIIEHKHNAPCRTDDIGNLKKRRQLKNTLALIESSYASPLTLEQLASAAGMSPKYFCHFFQQMTRRTPIDYLNHHRIEVAQYRLSEASCSITEVAYECGFNDLSYFIRVFKKYVGVTPKQYAAAHIQQR